MPCSRRPRPRSQDAALFAEMLSLPNDGRYPALELVPQQRRQRTLEALTRKSRRWHAKAPVLMIFEDAHWTDPTSLEALSRIVERIKTLPRSAHRDVPARIQCALDRAAACDRLTLNRLGEREAAAIIDRMAEQKLPADVMAGDRRAHRRHSAVCGGDDEGGAGGGERGRGPAHGCSGSSPALRSRRACTLR